MSKYTLPSVKWKLFVPWLQSQPEDRSFNYTDSRGCMLCAFLKETHGIKAGVSCVTWHPMDDPFTYYNIPNKVARTLLSSVGRGGAVTIKAVKDRLLK